MQPYLRYALRGLTKKPWRSFFIILMMIIGVMLMTGTTIALNSIPSMIDASVEEANMADYSLSIKPMPMWLVNQTCMDDESIQEYEVRLVFRSTAYRVKGWPQSTEILLIGVDETAELNKVTLVSGRYFAADENALVVEHDYGENMLDNDILVSTPTGNVTLKVVGTCRAVWMPRWAISSTAYAIVPLGVLQRLLETEGIVNSVLVKVKDGYDPVKSMNDLASKFEAYGPVLKSIEGRVVPFAETQTYYNYLVRLFSLIGFSLFAVSLTLMYSSLSLMVTQEIREIGTLKALGTTKSKILTTYALRSIFLGLIGSSLGAFLGVIVASALIGGFSTTSLNFEGMLYAPLAIAEIIQTHKVTLALYGSLGAVLSLALVLPSANSASGIFAAQAVKSFPGIPSTDGGSKIRFKRGPLALRYALRGISRRKSREAAVVLVIVISVAINSTLMAASEAQQTILNQTDQALNFDFFICLSKRFDSALLEKDLETFKQSTSFIQYAYYTQAKAKGNTVFLIGAPANASYFRYQLVQGRWFEENEDGIVLTEGLVKTLNTKVGEVFVISNEMTSISVTVVGIRRDLVFNVPLVSLSTAQTLDNYTGKVNAVVVKAKEDVDLNQLIRDMRRRLSSYFWHVKKSGVMEIAANVLTSTFQSIATVMIVFTWATSLFLIFSIAGQDINEERSVITVLRALGMRRRNCIMLIATKLLILGLFAALLCTLFTPVVLMLFQEFLSRTMTFSAPLYLSTGVLLTSCLFILATILPSGLALGIYATSPKMTENLRYE